MANRLYIYNKITFRRYLYGEIQSNYNMSLVGDGTKDSCKVVVFNHEKKEIDPITIAWLEETDTWWIVNSDKVKRYKNESGSFYEHTISLVGAFEIFNYRDMINCGFNANRYTYQEMFDRLERMFDFELNIIWDIGNYLDLEQKVTYLKTFQNYTPASAIKEIFSGLNLVPKLKFNQGSFPTGIKIYSATIYAIPKSGLFLEPINAEDYFINEEEQSSSNAESFGTRVISNVENCVSGQVIRYPNYGGVRLISEEPTVNYENGFIRLPGNIYEVKDLTIYACIYATFGYGFNINTRRIWFCNETKEEMLNDILDLCSGQGHSDEIIYRWDEIYENIKANSFFTLQNGGEYNKVENSFNDKVIEMVSDTGANTSHIMLNDKKHGTTAVVNNASYQCIYWEQGKDKIEHFNYMAQDWPNRMMRPVGQTDQYGFYFGNGDSLNFKFYYREPWDENKQPIFSTNYIPIGDLKVKVDNRIEQNDSNLYNQNGKLVDAIAVSKLINSYAEEISSNEVVRNGVFYKYEDIPQVGRLVNLDNEKYIINNVSIDFYENEYSENQDHSAYGDNFMICQFTMTKAVACKSTMISANTNIRDYECPQQNNVPRIQVYRDYIEFGYVNDNEYNDVSYCDFKEILNFNLINNKLYQTQYKGFSNNYTCFIDVDGGYSYTINTTKYPLNKQTVLVANFKDNNVIGYEPGQKYWLLQANDWSNWLLNFNGVNTPINYVDNVGELTSIDLFFSNEEETQNIYEGYKDLIGKSVQVPRSFIDNIEYKIRITEEEYDKDGLEVPVFEYCVEVGDNNGIVFGANFLKGEKISDYTNNSNAVFHYTITRFPANEIITQENGTKYRNALVGDYDVVDNPVDIYYDSENELLKIYIDGNGVNVGDNFVINMIGCRNDLNPDGGWFAENMLFGVNKCKIASSSEDLKIKYAQKYTLQANELSKTFTLNLGHCNLDYSHDDFDLTITDIGGQSYPSSDVARGLSLRKVGKVLYADIILSSYLDEDISGQIILERTQVGVPTLNFKVNNWRLK